MNIVNLPTDIVYEITKYVSLQDISHLKMSSFVFNKKINNVQNNIILNNMKILYPKKITNLNQTTSCSYNCSYNYNYSGYIIYLKRLSFNNHSLATASVLSGDPSLTIIHSQWV